MRTIAQRWGRGVAILATGAMLALAGCADPMMAGDKGMTKDKEMMKKEGGMMKDDKPMMEKK